MSNPSEYQGEYCGMGGVGPAKGGAAGGSSAVIPCSQNEDKQPVGGKAQARARAAAMAASATGRGLPAHDTDFVAQVYSEADRGTHRASPYWRDPRWSDERRIDSSTMYEQSERDPPNRNNYYVYRSTLVDALHTPAQPLAAPDVHKLRYMHNNYMTSDDWY